MRHIPNLITSLNLVSGFFGIIFALGGDLLTASWLILAAMIFDFFDGFSARMLKAYSDIGKELDSLADVVSFGVAPAVIIFRLAADSLTAGAPYTPSAYSLTAILFLFIPAMMPVFAALRLAIFNLDASQSTIFRGLPTPANAIAVISLVISVSYGESGMLNSLAHSPVFLSLFTIILSLLMVSRIKLLSLKVSGLGWKGNEGRYMLLGFITAASLLAGFQSFVLIIPLYIIASAIHFRIFGK